MRFIINPIVLLPAFLALAHGLVIPREEPDTWEPLPLCESLDICLDVNNLDGAENYNTENYNSVADLISDESWDELRDYGPL